MGGERRKIPGKHRVSRRKGVAARGKRIGREERRAPPKATSQGDSRTIWFPEVFASRPFEQRWGELLEPMSAEDWATYGNVADASRVKQMVTEELQTAIAEAEAELSGQGLSPSLWREARAYLVVDSGVVVDYTLWPAFDLSPRLQALIGRKRLREKGSLHKREREQLEALGEEVKNCRQCQRSLNARRAADATGEQLEFELRKRVWDHHRKAAQRLEHGFARADIDLDPAWAAVLKGAVAQAALDAIDRPGALFAAGSYLASQRLVQYLLKTLPPLERRAARVAFAAAQR